MSKDYEIIIGLEVHVQLKTESKLFCRCSTAFGNAPNTQTCPVCLGHPGVLPVLNEKAFRLGVKTALAFGCKVAPYTKFDRKHYYYPDLPKNFQISQYDTPFSEGGKVEFRAVDHIGQAHQAVEIDRAVDRVKVVSGQLELIEQKVTQLTGAVVGHLQADLIAKAARTELALHRAQQVIHLLLVDEEIGVAGDAKLVAALHLHPREQGVHMGVNDGGEEDKVIAIPRQLDQARQGARGLYYGHAAGAAEGILALELDNEVKTLVENAREGVRGVQPHRA